MKMTIHNNFLLHRLPTILTANNKNEEKITA